MLFYNQYSKPEDIDEIGERVLKEYFPTEALDDDTHSNAVNVIILRLIITILKAYKLYYDIIMLYLRMKFTRDSISDVWRWRFCILRC